jgi:serine/threonine protein kinase/WD40 repeat protein
MTASEGQRNPVEQLAEEFLDQYRRGERPAVTEYAARHPDLAEEIRDLFPALVMMEQAGGSDGSRLSAGGGRLTADGQPLERLGDYRIIREVGRGGMGVVYEAEQEALSRHVALKVLPYRTAADRTRLQRFLHEARSAARLHHTNIVPVFEVGECGGLHYFAMQFIQGHSLGDVIVELRRLRAGKRDADCELTAASAILTGSSNFAHQSDTHYYRSAARVGLQVAEALDYAHGQRILHRDVKPANLILDTQGTAWVTDFGLAKSEGAEGLTETGDVIGTLRYMAPERFRGAADARSDVYGLGLTLYELLTLLPPFGDGDRVQLMQRVMHEQPPPPRRVDPHVPRDLETVVLKAIAKEPRQRYASAAALAEDLRRFLGERPVLARRAWWPEQGWRWARRNPGWAATLAAVVGLLLVIAVGGAVMNLRLQRALADARSSEQVKTDKLWQSLFERAVAKRSSGRVGQRFESLQAIREAAAIRVTPELRNEAIAALALPDVEITREWEGWPEGTISVDFDASLTRYVRLDRRGGVAVCRLTDAGEEVLARLPAVGRPPYLLRVWFSPDGRFVVVGHSGTAYGRAGGARVWRVDGAEPTVVLDEPAGMTEFGIAFHPDCRRLALGHGLSVSVYDLASGRKVRQWNIGDTVHTVAFHPRDGRLAVAVGPVVRLFDADSGSELQSLKFPAADTRHEPRTTNQITWVSDLAWHPDGRRLAVGCDDRLIHVWDADAAKEVMSPWAGHKALGIGFCGFNASGDRLVSYDWAGRARLWDATTGRLLLTMPFAFGLKFRSDGDGMLGYSWSGTKLWLCRIAAGRELRVLRRPRADPDEQLHHPAIYPDGRLLAASSDQRVTFFDLDGGAELASVRLAEDEDLWVQRCDPAGNWLTVGKPGLFLWPTIADASSAGVLRIGPPRRLVSPASEVGIGASADGRILAVPRGNGALVLDRDRPERQAALESQYDVRTCTVSPDGRWIVLCSFHWIEGQSAVRVWERNSNGATFTWRPVQDLPLETAYQAGFSPDGRWLATYAPGRGCELWAVETWRPGRRVGDGAFRFSADGRWVAVGDMSGAIRLFETATGREVLRLTGPEATVYQPAAFSPDGTLLVAMPIDMQGIYVWDLRLIRHELRALGLDWDAPEYPPANHPPSTLRPPLRVTVDAGFLRPPAETDENGDE